MPLIERHKITFRDADEALNCARHYAYARRDERHPESTKTDNLADEKFARLYARTWRDYQNREIGPCDTIPNAYTHWRAHGGMFGEHRCQRCGVWAGARYAHPAVPQVQPRARFVPLPPERAAEDFPTGQPVEVDPPSRLCQQCLGKGYREQQFIDEVPPRTYGVGTLIDTAPLSQPRAEAEKGPDDASS